MLKASSGIDQPQCGQEWFRELRAQRQSSSLSSSSFSSLSSEANQERSLGHCSQGSVSKYQMSRPHVAQVKRYQWHQGRAFIFRLRPLSHCHCIISKIRFQAPFDSACLHFTPSQGFWVLLSCHCHRQDSFRYLTVFYIKGPKQPLKQSYSTCPWRTQIR